MAASPRDELDRSLIYRAGQTARRVVSLKKLRFLKFLYTQRVKGFDVPSTPEFDTPETTAWFKARLAEAERYVEFGTGGSTYLAAQRGIRFICVDSDRHFLEAVRSKIERDGLLDLKRQTYVHADIGLTGPWGRPVIVRTPNRERFAAFARYSDPPDACRTGQFIPDLVLVDGRFRVACALKMVRLFGTADNWTILVDDYTNRPHYKAIEEFARLDRTVGRMAVFKRAPKIDAVALDRAIAHYEAVHE
ncbi:MAG TPA: hypothetical protein PK970_10700 [Hyphomicrobiaceae bacterium]|nr:hypothetical protein [Hyphomicrobiaceae bacterium]